MNSIEKKHSTVADLFAIGVCFIYYGRSFNYLHIISTAVASVRQYSHDTRSEEEFDSQYEDAFNDPQTDGWWIRKLMNDLQV
jgi:hypothetical protein